VVQPLTDLRRPEQETKLPRARDPGCGLTFQGTETSPAFAALADFSTHAERLLARISAQYKQKGPAP